jgi:hypothetical protein
VSKPITVKASTRRRFNRKVSDKEELGYRRINSTAMRTTFFFWGFFPWTSRSVKMLMQSPERPRPDQVPKTNQPVGIGPTVLPEEA